MLRSTSFHGWKALALTTARAELIVPLDIGPRVISCALRGGPNLFCNVDAEMGGSGEKNWLLRGGHRLWHAPEMPGRTYQPDNTSITAESLRGGRGLKLMQPVEEKTGIRKSLVIETAGPAAFKLTHRLENLGQWEVELAPWALTVMARDSYTTIPFNPKIPHGEALLPDYAMVPWTYTDFSDPVWRFHRDYLGIEVAQATKNHKLGLTAFPGWVANWQPGGTFVKYAPPVPGAAYPDMGCVFETYVCDFMNELETLGPLTKLAPGKSVEHVEHWALFAGLPKPDTDAVFAKKFRPVVERWIKTISAK